MTRQSWNLIHWQVLSLYPNAEIILLKLNDYTTLQHPTQPLRLVTGRVAKHSNRCPESLCNQNPWATSHDCTMLPVLSRNLGQISLPTSNSLRRNHSASFYLISLTARGSHIKMQLLQLSLRALAIHNLFPWTFPLPSWWISFWYFVMVSLKPTQTEL